MRFAVAAVAAGLAGSAVAQDWSKNATASDVYVTEVVTAFTTFCPEATMLTHGGSTYTVSSATTLTITHCPGGCTITKPVYSSVYTSCSGASCSSSMAAASSSPAAPVSMSSSMSAPASVMASASSAPVAPAPYTSMMTSMASAGVPYPSSNGSSPAAPYSSGAAAGTGSGSSPSSTAAPYTGAAGKAYAATGAGVLALVGLVAAL